MIDLPACVQYAISCMVTRMVTNCMLNFVDLCSTANVSVFLLAAQRYGFYIHGQCVHGSSDVNLLMWHLNFRAEEARFAELLDIDNKLN